MPPAIWPVDRAFLGDDALGVEFIDELLEGFQGEIAREDHADGLASAGLTTSFLSLTS